MIDIHSLGRSLGLGVSRAGGRHGPPPGVPMVYLDMGEDRLLITPKQALIHGATARGLAQIASEP